MKNTKITKILLIAISLMLLVGSAIGIAVSAEENAENYTYEIPYINISHGASSAMLFAVDAPIADAEAGNVVVTYTYYVGAEGKTAIAKYSAEITADANLGLPVFYTVGISPKDQAEEITVEAHKANAPEGFEPLYYSTSVGKYLYSKLYRDGLIFSSDANDQRLAKMYLAQIEYVSTCQDALWNADNEGNERKLLNTYNYVCVTDGTIAATGNVHDLIDGETVTLNYTGTSSAQIGWTVKTYDAEGEEKTENVTGNTVTLDGAVVVTPYIDPDVITFEDLELGYNLATETYYQNGVKRLAPDAGGYSLTVTKGRDGGKGVAFHSYYWLYPNNYDNAEHNVSLLQFDADCTSNAHNVEHQMTFRNSSNGNQFQVYWRYICSGSSHWVRFNVKDLVTNASYEQVFYYFPSGTEANTKFNVKIEYLWSTGGLKISVDDNVCTNIALTASDAPIYRVNFRAVTSGTIIFDNIKQTTIYADPTGFATPATPTEE